MPKVDILLPTLTLSLFLTFVHSLAILKLKKIGFLFPSFPSLTLNNEFRPPACQFWLRVSFRP
jgi:hypothetical protein